MCLGIPGKVLEVHRTELGTVLGTVQFGGINKTVGLDFVPEAQPGQFVIVHAGFAISLLDEEQAEETLRLLRELGEAAALEDLRRGEGRDEVR